MTRSCPSLSGFDCFKLHGDDLLRALRVCQRFKYIGTPLLDRHLSFPVSPGCRRCSNDSGLQDRTQKQRLRAIQVLADERRASHLVDLTVTDKDSSCRCPFQGWLNMDIARSFNDLSLGILASLLPKALQMRRLWSVYPLMAVLPANGSSLDISDSAICSRLIEHLSHIATSVAHLEFTNQGFPQLRHLSVLLTGPEMQTLPALGQLQSLHVRFSSSRRAPTISTRSKFVDFGRYPKLGQLYIDGDTWSGATDAFVGHSHSLTVCVLKGPLVVTTRFSDFFDMIAVSLRYLYCHGTHLVGRINTHFPCLQHLSLHKVIANYRVFPFTNCDALHSLAVEVDDIHTLSWLEDINCLLQDALLHTTKSLRSLSLRSGLLCILSPIAIHAILRAECLCILLLDGAVVMDGRDWVLLSRILKMEIVARIDSWIPIQVSYAQPPTLPID